MIDKKLTFENQDEKTNTRKLVENFGFKDMYKLLSRKEQYSEYTDKVSISDQLLTVLSELKELHEETTLVESGKLEKNENIRKELGDVIYTLSLSIISILKKGIISEDELQQISKENANKIYERCPQLLSGEKKSLEEEKRIWRERKKINGERYLDKNESF